MEIGLFLTFEYPETPTRRLYADALNVVTRAEELGFSSAWTVQQHFSPDYGRLPAPLPFLAAAGARTTTLALGTAVIALTVEHPLLLAEEASVTDALLDGRLRLGLGSGDSPAALMAFGLDPETRGRRFRTQLARLLSALEGRPGLAGALLHPALERSPRDLIWLGARSTDTAVLAGRRGLGLLQGRVEPGGGPPSEHQRGVVRAYRDAGGTRVTVARSVWLTDRPSPQDDPVLARALVRYQRSSPRRAGGGSPQSVADLVERFHVVAGSAGEVADALQRDLAGIDPTELLLAVDPGGLPPGGAQERLERVAVELVPLLS